MTSLGSISKDVRPALVLLAAFTVLTGVVYPLAVTGFAHVAFPGKASGSLVFVDGKPVASALVGQPFTDPALFWSRPSATSPAYAGGASSGSNLGPSNPALKIAVQERVAALRAADPSSATKPVPVDLVTASGSGLDPHLSVAAALYQVPRVARARGISEESLNAIVAKHTEGRTLGLLGEPRVNIVALNLELMGRIPAR